MEIKRIETYSLYEFCQVVQEAIIDGWRFDFESNELFPTAFGSMLVTGMVKAQTESPTLFAQEIVKDNIEETPAVNIEVKRGRKPKE